MREKRERGGKRKDTCIWDRRERHRERAMDTEDVGYGTDRKLLQRERERERERVCVQVFLYL